MNRRAQALMISLWILTILSILAVGIGHRVSMALRMSRYQRDSLKALYLAKAGVNLAIVELEKDNNDYDALTEKWADNEELFKEIVLRDNPDASATVSFQVLDKDNNPKTIYGVRDEESKININTASKELLLALFEKCGISPAQDIVNSILIWRGDIVDDNKIYENLGYPCKSSPFTNIEELNLVKDLKMQDYQKINKFISVFAGPLININTVSEDVLLILSRSLAKKIAVEENFADSVATKILELRSSKGYFKDKGEVDLMLTGEEETNIFNALLNATTLKSEYFLIEVTGNSSKIKRKIQAVYHRKDKKISGWHES